MKLQPSLVERFWSSVSPEPNTGCWLWAGSSYHTDGYGLMTVAGRSTGAHRISFAIHNGEIAKGLQICHSCDVPSCVNPLHLFAGTIRQNMNDRTAKGRQAKGSAQGSSVFTEDIVMEIRRLRASMNCHELARMFGSNHSNISKICRGKSWKHVPLAALADDDREDKP